MKESYNVVQTYDPNRVLIELNHYTFIVEADIIVYDVYYMLYYQNICVGIAICGKTFNEGLEIWKIEIMQDYRGLGLSELLLAYIVNRNMKITIYCINLLSLSAICSVILGTCCQVCIITYCEYYRKLGYPKANTIDFILSSKR